MMIAVIGLGVFMLALWSSLMWAAHGLWGLMTQVPWAEAVAQLKAIPTSGLLEPWLGPAWHEWIDAVAPFMQWLGALVQGSAAWLAGAVPVLLWLVWGLGAALLLVLMLAGAGAVMWFRKRQPVGA